MTHTTVSPTMLCNLLLHANRLNKLPPVFSKIGRATGKLRKFIIEPFVAHQQEEEAYVSMYSTRDRDTILFYHEVSGTTSNRPS